MTFRLWRCLELAKNRQKWWWWSHSSPVDIWAKWGKRGVAGRDRGREVSMDLPHPKIQNTNLKVRNWKRIFFRRKCNLWGCDKIQTYIFYIQNYVFLQINMAWCCVRCNQGIKRPCWRILNRRPSYRNMPNMRQYTYVADIKMCKQYWSAFGLQYWFDNSQTLWKGVKLIEYYHFPLCGSKLLTILSWQ